MNQTCDQGSRSAVDPEVLQLREQISALEQLLEVYEQETLEKSDRLEAALVNLQQQAQQLSASEARYRRLAQQRELLNCLMRQIRQSLDVATILETAVTEICRLLELEACLFWWYRPATAGFSLVCENWQNQQTTMNRTRELSFLDAPLWNTLHSASETAFNLELGQNALPYPEAALLKVSYPHLAQLILPIQTRSGHVGIIHCLQEASQRQWGIDEVELLQEVASQLAIALDQAELYEQSCQATAQAQAQAEELTQALLEIQKTPQLIQTEKMASLGQLVAGVAHEINNPVNFIHGNLTHAGQYIFDLLEMVHLYQSEYPQPTLVIQDKAEEIDLEFLEEDLPKLFNSMQVGADRICEIVKSLRTFSRLDEAEIKGVNIHEGLDSTLMLLQSRLKSKGDRPAIQVVKEYASLPEICCYAGQMNQVFMNILVNAIDALEESMVQQEGLKSPSRPSPTITISTALAGANQVQITIADNGPGMTEAVKQRLFDPFFTTKSVGKGTGLGMSISYQIITEAHHGELVCVSELGTGTSFIMTIPIYQHSS